MRRILIAICIVAALIVAAGFVLRSMLTAHLYPQAPTMPPIVVTPVEELLSQYETFLKVKAPVVFASLQPGLTDSEIDVMEQKYSLKLPPDIRALYRWRNGTASTANVEAFPDHRFVPLDVALATRDIDQHQAKVAPVLQRLAYRIVAGHRDSWIGLIVDAAGDGHYFDPNRSESQGSFFFCFAEDGRYVFYPAFRNYLAAVVECQKSALFASGPLGVSTADFLRTQKIWLKYGASPAR